MIGVDERTWAKLSSASMEADRANRRRASDGVGPSIRELSNRGYTKAQIAQITGAPMLDVNLALGGYNREALQ